MLYSFDFWEGLNSQQASDNAILQYDKLQKQYPDKPIILETGWPSDGTSINYAMPTEKDQSDYINNFVNLAESKNIPYYIFSYTDES